MPPLVFAGQTFRVAGATALYWPLRNALIVADLHLEKASWFAQRGQLLPPYDSHATLCALRALVEKTGAEEIWCLGDNFHDDEGPYRLSGDARALLVSLTTRLRWQWITGNHDAALPSGVGGSIVEEAERDGIVMRHRAEPSDPRPELSGHFHPKYRANARGQSVARACFVRSATKLILPAFGALTGGLAAHHPEILAAVGREADALLLARNRLLAFGLASR